jgi:thiol-disulfide isomerase/thioredoxin
MLIGLCAAALAVSPLFAQNPRPAATPGAPAGAAADAAPAANGKRTPEQISADLQKAGDQLRDLMTTPDIMLDPDQRAAAAPKVVPVMKRMLALFDEMAQAQPQAQPQIADARLEFLTILGVFGDADATATLARMAQAPDAQAVEARCGQQLVTYLTHAKDEAAQTRVLDEMEKIAKANPKEAAVGQALLKMANMGAASKAVSTKAEDIIVNDLKGEFATQVGEQIKGQRKMRDAVGKPVELAGTRVDGTAFSTRDWKGKVILVDFWATWCGPCIQELPRVKKAYLEHHAKGLEILGVSCDSEADELKAFLDKNKDMPWPQLFDAKQNPQMQWNPLAKEWGINAIPTMFLVDKKGVLRSVEARKDFEEQIPRLLDEKAE